VWAAGVGGCSGVPGARLPPPPDGAGFGRKDQTPCPVPVNGLDNAKPLGDRMTLQRLARAALLAGLAPLIAGCGAGDDNSVGAMKAQEANALIDSNDPTAQYLGQTRNQGTASNSTIWDLFANNDNPNTTVEVNKYLWNASLDVLSFLPIESVDPFTGVISTGYGTPPGGNRSYRATIYVQDPALDARSLKVALQSRGGGAVPVDTQRAVEDAILTRARQLRVQDSNL
jgi:hypothetical protein